MKPRFAILVVIILALAAGFFVYPSLARKIGFSFPSPPFKFGLDIRGGTHLVYQADVSGVPTDEQGSALRGLKDVIERRVNLFGVSEPVLNIDGDNKRLIVELAGVLDVNEAIALIGRTPFLEFREPNSKEVDGTAEPFVPTPLTGRFLKRASLTFAHQTAEPQVSLEFNDRGAEIFAELTRRNIDQPLAIFLDGELLSAPVVQQEITGGQAQITGRFSVAEARELARNLNAGALPIPIELVSQQTIGPILGQESLQKSLLAGFIGFALVVFYMIAYYRLAGVVSALVLVIYAVFVLAVFKIFSVTLTLAGIVGFLLTIGVAVDANILVFERMKEELRRGRELRAASEEGFSRARSAIRDAYTSTFITAAVLYWFGTSLIRGFALTLALGLLIAYLVAFGGSRFFLRAISNTKISGVNFFGRPKN